MSPIKERTISGDFRPNLDESLCFTCFSGGKFIAQIMNGYSGSPLLTEAQHQTVRKKAEKHLQDMGEEHEVVIYHFENTTDSLHEEKMPV